MDDDLCGDRSEQGLAVKNFLAVKGRGTLKSFEDHLNATRSRDNGSLPSHLDTAAVVGIVDTRLYSAKAPKRKGMAPIGVPSELHVFAADEMARIWDPITIASTIEADVPLQHQGSLFLPYQTC